ncbi:MAG: hypothetical protein JNL28_09335 [Planctomycetes bacterium]|nr:hypothetical protein [Planctomycetota bacterium]
MSVSSLVLATLAACPTTQTALEPRVLLEGIVVLEENGQKRRVKEGRFEFWIRRDYEWTLVDVPVHAGAFSISSSPRLTWASTGRMLLDGHEAWSSYRLDGSDIDRAEGATIRVVITAQRLKPSTITVLDGLTGKKLEDIELVRQLEWSANDRPEVAVGSEGHLGLHLNSPIELPAFEDGRNIYDHGFVGIATYWLRAPGRTWNRIRIDPTGGGERVLRLWPARLVMAGSWMPPLEETWWFAVDEDDPTRVVRLSQAPGGGQADLETGKWQLQIRPTSADGNPIGPALASLDLQPSAEMIVSDEQAGRLVALASEAAGRLCADIQRRIVGTVIIPAAWKESVERICLVPYAKHRFQPPIVLDAVQWKASATDPELYHFEIAAVPPGSWCLALLPLSWRAALHVSMWEEREYSFALPPPTRVRLHVLDADTRQPIETDFEVSSETEGRFDFKDERRVLRSSTQGPTELRVPTGLLMLYFRAQGYADTRRTITIAPEGGEFTVELHRHTQALPVDIEIEAFDGEARIPGSEFQSSVRVWSVDNNECRWATGLRYGRFNESAYTFVHDQGRYRFALRAFGEYEAHPPIELDVTRDLGQRVVFHLTRRLR